VIADDENTMVAPGEGKAPLNVLKDPNVRVLAFPDLFPTGKGNIYSILPRHSKYSAMLSIIHSYRPLFRRLSDPKDGVSVYIGRNKNVTKKKQEA